MNAAQVAFAALVAAVLGAGVGLMALEQTTWGGIMLGVGLVGFLIFAMMLVNDSAAATATRRR